MMNKRTLSRSLLVLLMVSLVSGLAFCFWNKGLNKYKIGEIVDRYNGVAVYYNGPVSNVSGRNVTKDKYNLGLKYQCVEFVKRYYFERFHHKMPDSYGHARDFFQKGLADGKKNKQRDLFQFTNPSTSKPKVDDIIVFQGNIFNPYGHVAIISRVTDTEIEIVQQNPGPASPSRITIPLEHLSGKWKIKDDELLGWLSR